MQSRKEQIIEASARIQRLRRELRDAESELDLLLEVPSQKESPPRESQEKTKTTPPRTQTGTKPLFDEEEHGRRETLPAKIMARVRANPTTIFKVASFRDIADGSTDQTIRNALLRLKDRQKVLVSPKPGEFRLAEGAPQEGD